MGKAKQKKVDKALDMTFPASDPPASRQATGTEAPGRPSDRQAPVISKEEIEAAAAAGEPDRAARKPGQAAGRGGIDRSAATDGAGQKRPRRHGGADKGQGGQE